MSSPRDPFEGFERLFDRVSRQLEGMPGPWGGGFDRRGRFDVSFGSPTTGVDLAEREDAFVVTVDVPGYESDDLDVRLSGNRLIVSGERERERDEEGEEFIRRERRTDAFDRRVRIPGDVDADAVDATVNNGVLTVTLPKRSADEEARTIEVE